MKTLIYAVMAALLITGSVSALTVEQFVGLSRAQIISNLDPSFDGVELIGETYVFTYGLNMAEYDPSTETVNIVRGTVGAEIPKRWVGACLSRYSLAVCSQDLVISRTPVTVDYRGSEVTIRSAYLQAINQVIDVVEYTQQLQERLAYDPTLEELNSILAQTPDAPTIT